VDNISEALLPNVSRLMELDTIGRFNYAYVWRELWHLSSTKMPIFFTRIVSSIQHSNTGNIYHEHGSPKDMASSVAPKFNAINIHSLMEVNNLQLQKSLMK
jgi:hypothetical protein